MLFFVERGKGPSWIADAPLEAQPLWTEHVDFLTRLVDQGTVLAGGPLAGTDRIIVLARGDSAEAIERIMAADPWETEGVYLPSKAHEWTPAIDGIGLK